MAKVATRSQYFSGPHTRQERRLRIRIRPMCHLFRIETMAAAPVLPIDPAKTGLQLGCPLETQGRSAERQARYIRQAGEQSLLQTSLHGWNHHHLSRRKSLPRDVPAH